MHPFSTPLKTSEDLTIFWCSQGIEKGSIGNEWVNYVNKLTKYFWYEVYASPKTVTSTTDGRNVIDGNLMLNINQRKIRNKQKEPIYS